MISSKFWHFPNFPFVHSKFRNHSDYSIRFCLYLSFYRLFSDGTLLQVKETRVCVRERDRESLLRPFAPMQQHHSIQGVHISSLLEEIRGCSEQAGVRRARGWEKSVESFALLYLTSRTTQAAPARVKRCLRTRLTLFCNAEFARRRATQDDRFGESHVFFFLLFSSSHIV